MDGLKSRCLGGAADGQGELPKCKEIHRALETKQQSSRETWRLDTQMGRFNVKIEGSMLCWFNIQVDRMLLPLRNVKMDGVLLSWLELVEGGGSVLFHSLNSLFLFAPGLMCSSGTTTASEDKSRKSIAFLS